MAVLLAVAAVVPGCLPSPRMELSAISARGSRGGVWWSLPATARVRGPVVAVEQRIAPARVRQWVMDDRGVRVFDYRRDRLAGWGPPVPMYAAAGSPGDDFAVVRSLVGARFGRNDEPGWPGPAPPATEVGCMNGSDDLVAVLARHWPAARTDPPPGLSPHEIEQAFEAAEVTVGDLLKSGM